jgi:hypothetical protein
MTTTTQTRARRPQRETLTVRIQNPLKEDIQRIAAGQKRSMAAQIEFILESFAEQEKRRAAG